jgi:hypothetical protein
VRLRHEVDEVPQACTAARYKESEMTITFWAPDAPTRKELRQPEGYDEYEEESSVLPEIRLTSSNALTMLEALGVTPDLCGSWSAGEVGEMLRRAAALGTVHERVQSGVTAGQSAALMPQGQREDYIRHTAQRFVDLFRQAQDGGYRVCWG